MKPVADTGAGRTLDAARQRHRGSAAETFVEQLRALNFGERIVAFAGNRLLSVSPLTQEA